MQKPVSTSVMKSVFLRNGGETDKTRIVVNNLLRYKVPFELTEEETIVVEYFESVNEWAVISNQKLVFSTLSGISRIPFTDLKWVVSDIEGKLSGVVTPKTEMRHLVLQLQNGDEKLLTTEVGPPFWSIYSMLQFVAQNQNSRKTI
nr:hypothetical protein [uncultured Flavobacterium sp.]